VPNLFHVNFTDLPYWLPASAQLGLSGPIGGRRAFVIINDYTVAFFDQTLGGVSSPLLNDTSRMIPEAHLDARASTGN
jgi:hypothetical protein